MGAPEKIILDLRARRRELEFTQQYIADRVGRSRAAVGHWELGLSGPSLRDTLAYAHLLGCNLAIIIDEA